MLKNQIESPAFSESDVALTANLIDQTVCRNEQQAAARNCYGMQRPCIVRETVNVAHAHAFARDAFELVSIWTQNVQCDTCTCEIQLPLVCVEPQHQDRHWIAAIYPCYSPAPVVP